MSEASAQSGPIDRAIAQAFREVTGPNGGTISNDHVVDFINQRASEIDATTPPAGARDAVADEMVRRGVEAYERTWEAHEERDDDRPLSFETLVRAVLEATRPAESVAQGGIEFLKDPSTVHAMMLRGQIAIPSWRNIVDLRGEVPNGEDVQLARIAELQEQLAATPATGSGGEAA